MSKSISDEELKQSLQEFADKIEDVPTRNQVRAEEGDITFGATTYIRRFGSWNDALKAAGLGVNRVRGMSDDYLIDKLKELKEEIGRVPRQKDIRQDENTPSVPRYQDRFGSWNDALVEAGFEPNQRKNAPKEELIKDLQQLRDELGRPPKYDEISSNPDSFSTTVYEERFGSFNAALEAASLDPRNVKNLDKEYMLDKLSELEEELGRTPAYDDLQDFPTAPSTRTYERNFGTFNEALKQAGMEVNQEGEISREKLIDELQRAAEEHGKIPSVTKFAEIEDYPGVTTMVREFGSWLEAVKAAGLEPRDWSGPSHPRWKKDAVDRLYYGPEWPEQRSKARERDNYECKDCGITQSEHKEKHDKKLHVHHRKPLREFIRSDKLTREEGNVLDNLVTLCATCHKQWESLPVQIQVS